MKASTALLILLATGTARATPEQARTFKAQGDGLAQRGMAAEALAAYENAVKADPEWLIAYDALAAALFAGSQFDKVIALLRPMVDKHPDYANGWYSLGFAYRRTNKNVESLDAYERYMKLRPDEAEAHYGLARAALALGKKDEAATAFAKYVALEKRPSEKRYVEAARTELEALQKGGAKPTAPSGPEAESLAGRTPAAKAHGWCDMGDAALATQKFKDAYAYYQKARAVDPSSLRAYDGIGETTLRLRLWKEMVAVFRIAIADMPGYAPGFYYLARGLRENGKAAEAVEPLKRFVSLRPSDPEGQIELGMLLKDQGDNQGAVSALKKYLEVENRPGREAARATVEKALKELGAK